LQAGAKDSLSNIYQVGSANGDTNSVVIKRLVYINFNNRCTVLLYNMGWEWV